MPTITVTVCCVTVQPDQFDIHYWLFGVFVMLAVTAIIDGVLVMRSGNGIATMISSETFVILTMVGLFVGSLIALMMNTIPYIVSIVTFLAMLLYLWRGRQ